MQINDTCQAALDLFQKGFCPIPIKPATKKPACYWDRWREGLDEDKIRHHFSEHPDHELGVLTETGLLVLDADTPQGVAALHQLRVDLDLEPRVIVQTSRGEHHYYRLGDGVFAKQHAPKKDESPERFDIKAGRAMVVVPPSGARSYQVDSIEHANDLQALTQDQVDALFRYNGAAPPRPVELALPSAASLPQNDAVAASSKPAEGVVAALPRARALLDHITPDCSYSDWFRVCAALYAASGGEAEGFQLFDEWSSNGTKYKGPAETKKQWHYCRRYAGRRVTLATIAHLAREHGADLSAIAREVPDGSTPAPAAPVVDSTSDATTPSGTRSADDDIPLARFSLRGNSEAMRRDLKEHSFFIEGLASQGQVTNWFAPSNTGKTAIALHGCIDAVKQGRVDPEKLYYVNADDSFAGLTHKVELAEKHGFHMLAPGHRDFRAEMLSILLASMASKGQAADIVIVLDTLKKFVSLMEKNAARDFLMTVRAFVLKGGTVLALSHTNKNRRDDGSLIPAGTSDFVDDVDCAFVIDVMQETGSTRTVRFENLKNRGPVDRMAAYRYSTATGADYTALLDSVERVDEADIADIESAAKLEAAHPPELVASIVEHIRRGYDAKQQIVEKVAASTKFGQQKVRTTLDALEGDDPKLDRDQR